MNKLIKKKIENTLKSIGKSILYDKYMDEFDKLDQMNDVINLQKIIENYDELEPLLKEFFIKKAEQTKWER